MARTRDWSWVKHWSDLLQHDEVWCNAQGEILRLDDMDPGYCGRVYAFCMRQAVDIYELIGMQACSGPEPSGYQASIDFDRAFDDFLDVEPTAWLEQAPLLVALKNRAEGLPARPTVCHCGYPFQDEDGPWDHSACHPGIIVD